EKSAGAEAIVAELAFFFDDDAHGFDGFHLLPARRGRLPSLGGGGMNEFTGARRGLLYTRQGGDTLLNVGIKDGPAAFDRLDDDVAVADPLEHQRGDAAAHGLVTARDPDD